MILRNTLFASAAFLLLSLAQGSAATVTDQFDVSVSNLTASPGNSTPGLAAKNPVDVTFTITFDPTMDYHTDTYSGITLDSANIALGSPIGFNYDAATGALNVGGSSDGVNMVYYSPPANDFYLYLTNINTNPTVAQLGYVDASNGGYFYSTSSSMTSVSISPVSAVPLPGGLPLFGAALIGVAGFGAVRRHGRSRSRLPTAA